MLARRTIGSMVSKITALEFHFDGAQFGSVTSDSETDNHEMGTTDESGSKSRAKMVLQGATVFVLMFVVLWVGLSRFLSDE